MTPKASPGIDSKPREETAETAGRANFHTAADRMKQGHSRRKQMKRANHAIWTPKDRKHVPLDLFKASTKGRVPRLVALNIERMACSPFGYFRGAVPVMAYDLSLVVPNTSIQTQLCGDAHVRNLGAFAGPDGRLVFDINDFDETLVAPFEWDVKRMAASLILAGREASVADRHCREAAEAFLARYRCTSERFDDAIANFAETYADQTEKDHAQLVKSLKTRS